MIVYAPSTVQEMADYVYTAFDKADEYRTLAKNIDSNDMFVVPKPLKIDALEKLLMDFGLFDKN